MLWIAAYSIKLREVEEYGTYELCFKRYVPVVTADILCGKKGKLQGEFEIYTLLSLL